MKKTIMFALALLAATLFAEHVYPDNPDPTNTAFFGQLNRDSRVVTNTPPIVETDPTVPAWAKADEPPQTIKTNDVRNIATEVVAPVASSVSSLQSSKLDKTEAGDKYVPYDEATKDVDLGGHELRAYSLDAGEASFSRILVRFGVTMGGPLSAPTFEVFDWNVFQRTIKSEDPDVDDEYEFLGDVLESKADIGDIPDPYVPSATDPTFSNAVLAVGLNIDTNSVAVLNEIAATFGDFPITGTATTVGGLLAALAAAVAWLRKRTAHLESDGTADDDFANDLLGKPVAKAAIAYSLKTGTDAMTDRAVKTYDGTSAQVDVTFPTNIQVGITDFEAWIKMGATVQTVTYPDDDYTIEWKDGKVPTSTDYKASATNVVHFTIVKESETATPIVTAILAGFMVATPAA